MAIFMMRHPKIIKDWQHKCYGKSDIGIARDAMREFYKKLDEINALEPEIIIHSGLKRTKIPANIIAAQNVLSSVKVVEDTFWQERNFGEWEGQSWNAIYKKTHNQMDGFLTHPDSFAPKGGETTNQLIKRTKAALDNLKNLKASGNILIIAHGGTIAAARMLANELPFAKMVGQIPPTLAIVSLYE